MKIPRIPYYVEALLISLEDVHVSAENLLFALKVNALLSLEDFSNSRKNVFELYDSLDSFVLSKHEGANEIVIDYYRYTSKCISAKIPLTIKLSQNSDFADITLWTVSCISAYRSIGPDFAGNIWQTRRFYFSPVEAVISELNRLQTIRAND